MKRDVEEEAPRPRPHSGGIWTIFSWLRRSERSSSSESVSSVGSDRTAASFDFLSPLHYRNSLPPLVLTPKSPTDSYRKRLHERNLRRQRERDVTLHRKYGLWREEGDRFEGFTLPPPYRNTDLIGKNVRCRRAASECLQRRAAYVPGKRRAPQPPTIVTTSLPRNYKRKRPAPKPPTYTLANKENLEINNNNQVHPNSTLNGDSSKTNVKSEVKLDNLKISKPSKDTKPSFEKGFLWQIFENKKRHSAIEISQIKLLPSISELDKEAAEIIETNKMLHSFKNDNRNTSKRDVLPENMWCCEKCQRIYNVNIKSCVFCVPIKNKFNDITVAATNTYTQTDLKQESGTNKSTMVVDDDEKRKLKEMLKEMKHSLPKKSKDKNKTLISTEVSLSSEAPTLRIGSSINNNIAYHSKTDNKLNFLSKPTTSNAITLSHGNEINKQFPKDTNRENLVTLKDFSTKPLKSPISEILQKNAEENIKTKIPVTNSEHQKGGVDNVFKLFINNAEINNSVRINKTDSTSTTSNKQANINVHTPLKISSLLNPIYMPKVSTAHVENSANTPTDVIKKSSELVESDQPTKNNKCKLEPEIVSKIIKKSIEDKQKKELDINKSRDLINSSNIDHAARRDLIKQLELSIAKGDEKAASEAAVNLAKLKLSCSVLSFSSQIISNPSTSKGLIFKTDEINHDKKENEQSEAIRKDAINEVKTNKSYIDKKQKIPNIVLENTPTTSKNDKSISGERISISVWIEDKLATRGPVPMEISRQSKIGDLKIEAEKSFGVAVRLQRWIVGKSLCTDDSLPIGSLAGPDFTAPFYLCLVESDENKTDLKTKTSIELDKTSEKNASGEFYNELVQLEQQALVTNREPFECGVCMENCEAGNGAVLRECIHTFCRDCLSDVVRHCEEPAVSCPAIGCPGVLQDREIRALLSEEDYEKWLARGLAAAETGTRNTFHCRTTDCTGWAFCEPGVRRFPCPVCKHTNCVQCQAVHEGETCEEYQKKLRETVSAVESNNTDEGTQALLNSLITRGEALECPECRAIITKKWGCDWVKCSACKTEICWITKGRRWGPGGRGDTSGGCRCGVDGKRCHPSCGYCH